ncbi:hypothetical protein P3342_002313 [Pyrenophora teres f. teres]|nr:hypothetical protein P3342_002313 [Pyrenophora teres f. teres]
MMEWKELLALTQGIGQRHAQHSSARPPSPPDLHQSRLETVNSPWAEGNAKSRFRSSITITLDRLSHALGCYSGQ